MNFNTLSGRFLGLIIVFVMIAEVLIFVPSVSRFREDYLQNRLELGQLAALALLATPDEQVAPDLEAELLATADVYNVALRREGVRELALQGEVPDVIAASYNLQKASDLAMMRAALKVYFAGAARVIRVIGQTKLGERSLVEITMSEEPLRAAMIAYGLRILYLSLAITLAFAALLFFAARHYIVQPIRRVVDHMTAYRDDPEDARRVIAPTSDVRELREAETALHELQLRLTGALKQKERLAALGGAVAKISHDLRNLLTTAQLLADRIEGSADPAVRRTAPKLVAAISRAITLCERTLTYGKAEEAAPALVDVDLAPIVDEVVESEAAGAALARVEADVTAGLRIRVDADQLFRVLTNLVRNAVQAIEALGQPGVVRIAARPLGDLVEITVSDTGPGLPEKARENLFQPFRGGARRGGAGLGLVIAAELVRGHGGALELAATGPDGTVFRVTLPAALAEPAPRRARSQAVR
ncbi:HAMP domain-containing sensor histidine kinase [Amaricoccus sp.]|uniref:sensor histidine kinase n=1 Tax=Amaricoccus sp. TaxID=1872485 RepID=UPI001B619BA3|nr:HAMP domain-containing sensor histidine kinase [Amaricoccus sp.]MBP7240999.1 HAMP domain-containing histidine kinase [Amaricoccus sp.]